MITQEQIDRYEFQKTEAGKTMLQMAEWMRNEYCTRLSIPISKIKTGKLKPLVNPCTGKTERFIEE